MMLLELATHSRDSSRKPGISRTARYSKELTFETDAARYCKHIRRALEAGNFQTACAENNSAFFNMKILFQGDSITDAFRKPEESNPAFQLGNGYVFLAAARLALDYPERHWEVYNRGVSGQGIRGLRARWRRDALELRPDLLSLMIGVNDTLQAQAGNSNPGDDEFAQIYTDLVESLRQENSGIRLILLEPFLLPVGRVTPEWLQHLKPRQAFVRQFAAESGATFIPVQELMNQASERAPAAYWAYDGIHPTHAGFALLADAWLSAAKGVLVLENP